jgi:hypothetical protein
MLKRGNAHDVAHHPAVQLAHHRAVLEHGQKIAGRQQESLFLAQAHERLGHMEGARRT